MSKLNRILQLFMPSMIDTILIALFFSIMVFKPISCYDLWWHLRTGETLLSGNFPTVDIFSFSAAGKEWILHEWLSEVIFAFIHRYSGLAGLLAMKALISTLTISTVYGIMRKRGINIFLALIVTGMTIAGAGSIWTVRPHIFTMLFIVMLADWLYQYWDHGCKKILYLMPLLFFFWVNLHGGFILGFVFLAIIIGSQIINNLLKVDTGYNVPFDKIYSLIGSSTVSFMFCFLNPNTYKGVLYPFLLLGDKIPNHLVTEWQPATIQNSIIFMIIVFFMLVTLCFSSRRPRFFESAILIVFIFWSFKYQRMVGYFSVLCLPLMAGSFQELISILYSGMRSIGFFKIDFLIGKCGDYIISRSKTFGDIESQLKYHGLVYISIITISFIAITGILPDFIKAEIKKENFPDKTFTYLKEHKIEGNILNKYGWGGYLIYKMPEKKVFIDGRLDVYQKEIMEEYYKVYYLKEGWEEVIDRYSITHVLLGPDSNFSKFITRIDSRWSVVSKDDNSLLFVLIDNK